MGAESVARPVLTSTLANENVPKAVHDWKTALRVLEGTALRGVQHDTRLYAYLLDPTYSSHTIPEVALRRFNLKLSGSLAEAADITGRLADALRKEVEQAGLLKIYAEIDRPLGPVLTRMEQAGGALGPNALGEDWEPLESGSYVQAK